MNSKHILIILQLITITVTVQSLTTPFKDCGKCHNDDFQNEERIITN